MLVKFNLKYHLRLINEDFYGGYLSILNWQVKIYLLVYHSKEVVILHPTLTLITRLPFIATILHLITPLVIIAFIHHIIHPVILAVIPFILQD